MAFTLVARSVVRSPRLRTRRGIDDAHDSIWSRLGVSRSRARRHGDRQPGDRRPGRLLREGEPRPDQGRRLTSGRTTRFPPWWGGGEMRKPWKVEPYSGQGYESAVAYAVARQLGFTKAQVDWRAVPFGSRTGRATSRSFYMAQVSFTPQRERVVDFSNAYYYVNQALVGREGTAIASASTRGVRPYRLGAQLGTTSYQYIVDHIRPSSRAARLRLERPRRSGAQERPDRRDRRRSPNCVLRHGGTGGRRRDCRPVPEPRQPGTLRDVFEQGNSSSAASTGRSTASGRTGR